MVCTERLELSRLGVHGAVGSESGCQGMAREADEAGRPLGLMQAQGDGALRNGEGGCFRGERQEVSDTTSGAITALRSGRFRDPRGA